MRLKQLIQTIFLLCVCSYAFTQPIREHLEVFPSRAFKNPSFNKTNSNLRTESTALTLPFWEDFSDTSILGNHFKPHTGIYFNNHLCLNQPSVNVATFDGLDEKGQKYDPSYIFQMDKADSLVSLDIDISGISPSDSLYFSFHYQSGGYGEIPDQSEGDSLILQFYTKDGKWKSVWQSDFAIATDTALFYPVLLKVTDSSFFHSNFKFKFFNYARLSGMYDLWHVDYIVIDTIKSTNNNRQLSNGKLYFSDLAISKSPTSIITPYQAIPVNHFTNNSFNFKNSFDFTISNLSLNPNTVEPSYALELRSKSGNSSEPVSAISSADVDPGIFTVNQSFSAGLTPVQENFELVSKVFIKQLQPNSGNFLFENNDTVISIFPFKNYYAYDDGEYEYGVRFDQVNAILAQGFSPFKDDTLTHIDLSIPYIGYDIRGSQFYLKVWNDKDGKPGDELYSWKESARYYDDSTSAPYSNGLNPFTRYEIKNKTVIPNGRFYIGIKQLSGNKKAIRLGFDSNNNSKENFWYDNNQGSGWSQFRNLNGTVMMRPVFADGAKNYSNLRQEEPDYSLSIYPNPNNTDLLTLNDTFDNVRIYDQTGRLRLSYDSVAKIDISSLEPGYFFVKAIINGTIHHQKLSRSQK